MRAIIDGDAPHAGETHCWNAITCCIKNWECRIQNAVVHARLFERRHVLELSLEAPGGRTEKSDLDVTWLSRPDQAEFLAIRTLFALRRMEQAMKTRLYWSSSN